MLTSLVITPELLAALDGALELLAEQATIELHAAKAAQDVEAGKLARNHAGAYRRARLYASRDDAAWHIAPNGDLLVRSSGGSATYVVRRAPAGATGYSPIVCSCPHGEKGDAIGLCWHEGLYLGLEQSTGVSIADRDDAAGRLPFEPGPDDDDGYADSFFALEGPWGGDVRESEIVAMYEAMQARPRRAGRAA